MRNKLKKTEKGVQEVYLKVGEELRKQRLSLGYSQSHIAEMVGLTRMSIHSIEKGEQRIRLDILIKLSRLLEFDLAELLQRLLDEKTSKTMV